MVKRIINGVVTKISGRKTIKVTVCTRRRHKRYVKYVNIHRNFLVHDEHNQCVVGDSVLCIESRPLSKRKCFMLLKIKDAVANNSS